MFVSFALSSLKKEWWNDLPSCFTS